MDDKGLCLQVKKLGKKNILQYVLKSFSVLKRQLLSLKRRKKASIYFFQFRGNEYALPKYGCKACKNQKVFSRAFLIRDVSPMYFM